MKCQIPIPALSSAEQEHKAQYSVDVSAGQVQCSYTVRINDTRRACALQKGHPGMHCHGYKTPSPKEGWEAGGCAVCGRQTRFEPCDECGVVTCQDCGPCLPPRHIKKPVRGAG